MTKLIEFVLTLIRFTTKLVKFVTTLTSDGLFAFGLAGTPWIELLSGVGQEEKPQSLLNFVANTAKRLNLLVCRGFGGIIEAPVNGFGAWEYRAVLFGTIADGDHVIKLVIYIDGDVFRGLARDIDAQFLHRLDASGMQPLRMGACAECFKPLATEMTK